MGAKKTVKPKHTPAPAYAGSDGKPKTWSSVQRCRSTVGILLYVSCDMVQCSWMIRNLAQSMSKPRLESWNWTSAFGLLSVGLQQSLDYRSDFDRSDFLRKTFTDSDWASNNGTRKSVSACCLLMNNCLFELWKSKPRSYSIMLCRRPMQQPQEVVMRFVFHYVWNIFLKFQPMTWVYP